VINLPTVTSRTERASEPKIGGSGERALQKTSAERSGEQKLQKLDRLQTCHCNATARWQQGWEKTSFLEKKFLGF